MTDHKKKILIILNPVAGRSEHEKFSKIIEILKSNNLDIEITETKEAGHGKRIAAANLDAGFDMIVAAGGDGTVNEVLNGIYPHQIPFGLIPLGTVNVLAKEIKLADNAASIANCIITAHHKICWLGNRDGHYFSLMVSAGLDAMSVANVSGKLKRLIGKNAYALSFLKELIKSQNIKYIVTANGKAYDASNVIITNGKYYGGEYICAPDAALDKNQLYLLMSMKFGRWNALKYAFLMLSNKYPYSKDITIIPANRVTINCAFEDIPIQMDGDDAGILPARITMSDHSINLVQPE
jgi:YegS/Rv2252/BmrU family lipid kinase